MTARPDELGARTNVDVVRETYEAVGRGDIPALLDLLTDDVEWTPQGPSVIPFAGTRRGREETAEFFSLVGENLEFEQFEPRGSSSRATRSPSWVTSAVSSSRRPHSRTRMGARLHAQGRQDCPVPGL